jgi:transposase
VLAFSRHLYAEVVFDQRVETWLLLHRHAFELLGGVPERVVLDYVARNIIQVLCPIGLCGRRAVPKRESSMDA